MIFNGVNLQSSIDDAIALGVWLDLGDRSWPFSTEIVVNGNPKIRNGTLDFTRPSGVTGTVTAITINGTPTLVDFTLHRTAGPDLVGIHVVNPAIGSMTRCKFSGWRSVSTGLKMTGGQIFYFYALEIQECDQWLHLDTCTDFRFFGVSFSTAVGGTNMSGVLAENCANVLFDGVSIQNNRQGHLLELSSCSRTVISGMTRFEDVGSIIPGVSSHIHLSNGTTETTINASFNNTHPSEPEGVYPPVISDDGTSSRTATNRCLFPASSPTISLGLDNKDDGALNYKEAAA